MRLLVLFLIIAISSNSEAKESLGDFNGLVIDQTISPIGHSFYEELIMDWNETFENSTITVNELPNPLHGSLISVNINETIVFQDNINMRASGFEEKIIAAKNAIKFYFQNINQTFN